MRRILEIKKLRRNLHRSYNAIVFAVKVIVAVVRELIAIISAGGWVAVIIILVMILLAVMVGVVARAV